MDIRDQLLQLYQSSAQVEEVVSTLRDKPSARLLLKGSTGSHMALVLASIYLKDPKPILFIANDKEEAAYMQNDLETFLKTGKVSFFPDSFKQPGNFARLNSSNVLLRTETISKIVRARAPHIICTYPEALFEQVVDPGILKKNQVLLTKNEDLDVDFLIEVLTEYGFNREDFVFEPGQFSIRGGIIDIFSYGNEWPYRIELFDTEIESIRTFDPATQLSRQSISKLTIIPNVNTKFDREQKVSLLSVLEDNALVWVHNLQFLVDKLQKCFESAKEFSNKLYTLDDDELAEIFRDRTFIRPGEVITDIESYGLCLMSVWQKEMTIDKEVVFETRPQPSFNKNFKLLLEHLGSNSKNRFENYLFAENPKQIERFHAIFEDLGATVKLQAIAKALSKGFIDEELKVACYTDHQIFERFHRYRVRKGFSKDKALNARLLRNLEPGDYVTHIDHGVGKFSGLEKIEVNGRVQESVRLIYKNNDILYVGINSLHKISKYVGKEGSKPALSKIGSDTWSNLKRKTKKKVKDIAKELIKLYAKRKASEGFAFQQDGYLQNELEASFMYEDTPDQFSTTQSVKEDMMKPYPMDRLICGDVGFGKTEIAIRAAFKAVVGGKQVAVLVPTTILALQHYQTFSERLKEFDLKIDYVNRFRSSGERKGIFTSLEEGQIDIIIGTHSLLNKAVKFKDLGLLIVDEEQKFGVGAKEKLRNIKVNVDTLTLTATPIPRTLQFSLMAARDLSVIRTPPPNRQPIHTEVRVFNEELIKDSIYYEINRGGQVFFVHNRVKSLADIASLVQRMCPDVDVAMAHGQMDPKNLEKTLLDFINRRFDVLVCTNIIETGLDIANANTIIINNAHQFGMSDLHQLRGRVGRSNKKAFCYLFCPPMSTLTSDARKRLKVIEEHSALGSGFNIAMRDLDIRGAGNLLGGEQSGFISDIGYETYQKILEEAIEELKETDFKDVFADELSKKLSFVRDVQVDTDVEMMIPSEYVSNTEERLALYNELDRIETEEQIKDFISRMQDRFGKIPKTVKTLFEGLRLRWECKRLGFERVLLKNNKLRCYFVSDPQSSFYETNTFQSILKYVSEQGHTEGLSFKKSTKYFMLIKENVDSLRAARHVLAKLDAAISAVEI